MLGPASGTIGCVGVAPPRQGQGIGTALVVRASEIPDAGTRNCHIGWTTRESLSAAPTTSRGDDTPSSPAPPDRLRLPPTTSPENPICRRSARAIAATATAGQSLIIGIDPAARWDRDPGTLRDESWSGLSAQVAADVDVSRPRCVGDGANA